MQNTNPLKILIADDDNDIRELIVNLLTPMDFKIYVACNGREAYQIAESEKPDIITTDIDMPYMTGYELCKKIKSDKTFDFIYVIVITGSSISSDDIAMGFDYGADDYICKPFNHKEFLGRIKSAVRIKTLHDEVRNLSILDPLTGLHNRRYFDQFSSNELYRAERYKRPISCLMIDIDFFKKINDSLGHEAGDKVLKSVAEILKNNIRKSDAFTLCRYGGEEFILLLPETDQEGAIFCAEKLRKTIDDTIINYEDKPVKVTISIGISTLFKNPVSETSDVIRYADIALYKAKEAGRNCIKHISS